MTISIKETTHSTSTRHAAAVLLVVLVWITAILLSDAHASLVQQRILGGISWALLIALVRREAPLVKAQVAAVVIFATLIEFTASPLLQLYVYRLQNVPSFVPPGHGLVYFAALTCGRSELLRRHLVLIRWSAISACGAWAAWGLVSVRTDTLGAVLYLIFATCILVSRAPGIYAAAFVVTAYLELLGTSVGNWTWSAQDPAHLFSIGNPPSGIAGGYCVIEWVGLIGGRSLLNKLTGLGGWSGGRQLTELLKHGRRDADDAGQKTGDLGPALAPVG